MCGDVWLFRSFLGFVHPAFCELWMMFLRGVCSCFTFGIIEGPSKVNHLDHVVKIGKQIRGSTPI